MIYHVYLRDGTMKELHKTLPNMPDMTHDGSSEEPRIKGDDSGPDIIWAMF